LASGFLRPFRLFAGAKVWLFPDMAKENRSFFSVLTFFLCHTAAKQAKKRTFAPKM